MGEWETHCEALYRRNLRLNKSRLFLIPLKKSYNLVSQGNLYVLICEYKVMVWYFQSLGFYVTKVRAVLVHYIFSVWWTLFLSLHVGSQAASRMSTLGIKTALQCVLLAHSDESDGNLRQGVYIWKWSSQVESQISNSKASILLDCQRSLCLVHTWR